MGKHDELLQQGPREAPEPETAEQRSKRIGAGTAAGGIVAGGAALAKLGVLGKFFLWIIAWHGAVDLWRIGGWIAVALVAAAVAIYLVVRARREERL
jgi:protein-S-isoprenylcysteine O-methyltransferase Ste14